MAANTLTQTGVITGTELPKGETVVAFGAWPVAEVDVAGLFAFRAVRPVKQTMTHMRATPAGQTRMILRIVSGPAGTNRDLELLRRAFNWH